MRRHAAELFFLDKHRDRPDFKELKLDFLDTTEKKEIKNLKDGGKVFVIFVHTARLSANVNHNVVISIVEKFGADNVILLGLAPNNMADGVPYEYELPTTNHKLRCLQLGWETATKTFSKFQKQNEEAINNIKEICGVTLQQPGNTPDASNEEGNNQNNDTKADNNKPTCPFKFVRNNKAKFMFACATAIGIVVLCSKKPEILTNFKELISKLCSSISGVFIGR